MKLRKFTLDDENNILEDFRISNDPVLFFPEDDNVKSIFQSIHVSINWSKWISSNGKGDLPPDYYCEECELMMEVMRFDDCSKNNGKVNAKLAKEREILFESIRFESIADTGLETADDHNYQRYIDNFRRVIEKHAAKVEIYRDNHKGHQLIFFVFDESSGVYHESENGETFTKGVGLEVSPHHYWADETMVRIIKECGADYLVLYKPYAFFGTPYGMRTDVPKLVFYDTKNMDVRTVMYDPTRMVSSEL